ncbi:hypothetical protein STAN_7047 [Streptomyces sp. CBMAI 2042]|nr:hypothetical protein STAN_7047 [Streptomyces sp. CBMAI 2042]
MVDLLPELGFDPLAFGVATLGCFSDQVGYGRWVRCLSSVPVSASVKGSAA